MSAPHSPGAFRSASDSRSAATVTSRNSVEAWTEPYYFNLKAVGGRVLHDGAELPAREFVFVVFVDDQFDAERLAAREQHVERLREDVAVDEELIPTFPDGIPRT